MNIREKKKLAKGIQDFKTAAQCFLLAARATRQLKDYYREEVCLDIGMEYIAAASCLDRKLNPGQLKQWLEENHQRWNKKPKQNKKE